MTVPWNFTLNVNLQEGAVQQLEFLQEMVSHSALDDEKVLKHSIYRYENYWLPLAGKHPNETLAAPLDVEWIWLCHMLSPVDYQRDCNMLIGRVVSHRLYSAMQRRKFQQKARSLWQAEYPQEPFHRELHAGLYFTDDDLPSRLSCDVLAATSRQRIFHYQVSLPHFRDAQFLATCEMRYKRFLFLKQQNQDEELVPSYDIDLMWHTHMLHPLAYKIDTETILGYTLPHDKLLDGANPGLHVSDAFVQTGELWRSTFDVNFEVCGSTYRGEPTAGKLHALTPQQNFMASTKTATFIIEKVDVQGLPTLKGKLIFKLYTGLNGKIGKCAATFKGEPPWQGKAVPATDFETDSVNYLKIRVIDQKGMLACFGSREIVGEKDIDLRPTLDSLTHETSVEHSVSLSQVYGATVAHVTTHFCWPQRGPVHLYLRVGIFTKSPVPEKPETVFCHVPIRNLPVGIENATYLAASHSFVNHSESVVLTCRVLHSVDLLQSALYLFYQDKMVAVAHLVGLDQLPLPTQISDPRKVPYLNPRAGERAVLIKNHGGDWAVVIGRWAAHRKGGSRIGSRRGKEGLPGQLMIRVRLMAEFGWRELQLTYNEQHWRFTLDDLHADLKEGTVRIDNPDSEHITEKIALTFAVALLHVLCMPRPSGGKRGISLRRRTSRRTTRSSKWIPSEEMPFILAAGVLQEAPTNGYIRQTHATNAWTSDREAMLGPRNTDLLSCRPEDGLGGMWAHVTPGLNELFVQGSHVVPDGNSGCSTQIFPDGNSSCSQLFLDSNVPTPRESISDRKAEPSLYALTVPGGKPVSASSLTIPDVKSRSPTLASLTLPDAKTAMSNSASNGKLFPTVLVVSDVKTEPGGMPDSEVKQVTSLPAVASGKTVASDGKPSSSLVIVPGEKSFGISALTMLGGKISTVHSSGDTTKHRLPSVSIEDTSCSFSVIAADATAGESFDTDVTEEETPEGQSAENQDVKAQGITEQSPGEQNSDDQASSSSSSFQAAGEIRPDSLMLGFPDAPASPFLQGSKLSPRDMIDICEERIYSDYKCSLETGGVDDLIIINSSDTRFDDADKEIIVAVQSRRNSRRKDGPQGKTRTESTCGDCLSAPGTVTDEANFAGNLSAALTVVLAENGQSGSESTIEIKDDATVKDICEDRVTSNIEEIVNGAVGGAT